ncbi:MAG: hypothetical protein VX970_05585 [Planctomycetota bacterium]|nr:hypothetical protein [Planctomycetota bacterium]MEC8336919.1 hypothetical protein [Planctomycetota bacterium]
MTPSILLVELYELQSRLLFAITGTAALSPRVLAAVVDFVRATSMSHSHR